MNTGSLTHRQMRQTNYQDQSNSSRIDNDQPLGFDILLGRGKVPFNHIGNQRFRQLIGLYVKQYIDSNSINEKTFLVNSVYEEILAAGGRFLDFDSKTNKWAPVSPKNARQKVGHAFRDAASVRCKKPHSGEDTERVGRHDVRLRTRVANFVQIGGSVHPRFGRYCRKGNEADMNVGRTPGAASNAASCGIQAMNVPEARFGCHESRKGAFKDSVSGLCKSDLESTLVSNVQNNVQSGASDDYDHSSELSISSNTMPPNLHFLQTRDINSIASVNTQIFEENVQFLLPGQKTASCFKSNQTGSRDDHSVNEMKLPNAQSWRNVPNFHQSEGESAIGLEMMSEGGKISDYNCVALNDEQVAIFNVGCGTVRNHLMHQDIQGKKPRSEGCRDASLLSAMSGALNHKTISAKLRDIICTKGRGSERITTMAHDSKPIGRFEWSTADCNNDVLDKKSKAIPKEIPSTQTKQEKHDVCATEIDAKSEGRAARMGSNQTQKGTMPVENSANNIETRRRECATATVSFLSEADDQRDRWAENVSSPPIFGRAQQIRQLRRAYEQVVECNSFTVVMVHGASGVGKTALVETLRATVCESRGYFCSGKFSQNSALHEPYSAIMTAFSDLCDLVSQSDDFTEERRKLVQKALGAEYVMLSKVVSNLSSVIFDIGGIKESGISLDLKNECTFNKFKGACTSFLHVMASREHPIVLFIDDIQWMDEGSTHLINSFLKQTDFTGIMLVLTYRDEEAHVINALSMPGTSRIVDVQVENLDINSVHQILSSYSEAKLTDLDALSDLVWQKTNGNPFHVHQLIDYLQREGWLSNESAPTRASGTFDVDDIQRHVQISENVAELLMKKATKLDPKIQHVLQVASVLGFRFRASTLVGICSAPTLQLKDCGIHEVDSETASSSLYVAVQEGFLEQTADGYQFGHDKLQSFFQSCVSDVRRTSLHRVIGEWFLQHDNSASQYFAAKHLNQAVKIPGSKGERLKMTKLNLHASIYCRDKSAFIDAAVFLRRAYQALDEDISSEQSDLAFEITESLAKMELIVGKADHSASITRRALLQYKDPEQKVKLMLVDLDRQTATNDIFAALETIKCTLKILGVKLPSKVSSCHVLIKLKQVNTMMRSRTKNDILALPILDDFLQNSVLKLLFLGSCSHVTMNALIDSILYFLLAIELTLKNGLSPYSAPAFPLYAMCEVAFGNYGQAHVIGNLALELSELVNCKEAQCATLVLSKCLVSHFFESFLSLKESFDQNTSLALETGNINFALISWCNSGLVRCFAGENLVESEAFLRLALKKANDIGLVCEFHWITPIFQYVLNMQSHGQGWIDLIALNGDVIIEDEFTTFALKANNCALLWQFWLLKLNLAYHFGFYQIAESYAAKVATFGKSCHSHFGVYLWYFLVSSVGFELFCRTGRRSHLRSARRHRKALTKLEGSPNSVPFLHLLTAQEMASRRKSNACDNVNAYMQAISTMAEAKWVHMEGLANEQLAFYLSGIGRRGEAKAFFASAMQLYRDGWGSAAKYEWLQEMSALALENDQEGLCSKSAMGDSSTTSSGKSSVWTKLFSS